MKHAAIQPFQPTAKDSSTSRLVGFYQSGKPKRRKEPTLPPVPTWQNPHRIVVQTTKVVRGWGS